MSYAAACRGCAATPCERLRRLERGEAACPISYRQNALKMPQASRAVIIEETVRASAWERPRERERERERGRDIARAYGGRWRDAGEVKLRQGKLRAAVGLREEDDDARCHMRPRRYCRALNKLLRTDSCDIAACRNVQCHRSRLYEEYIPDPACERTRARAMVRFRRPVRSLFDLQFACVPILRKLREKNR